MTPDDIRALAKTIALEAIMSTMEDCVGIHEIVWDMFGELPEAQEEQLVEELTEQLTLIHKGLGVLWS